MLTKEWVAQNTKKFFWHNTMPVRASVFWWGPNLHTMETMNLFSVLAVLSQQTSFELTCNGLSWAGGNWHHFCEIVCAHCVWKTDNFWHLDLSREFGLCMIRAFWQVSWNIWKLCCCKVFLDWMNQRQHSLCGCYGANCWKAWGNKSHKWRGSELRCAWLCTHIKQAVCHWQKEDSVDHCVKCDSKNAQFLFELLPQKQLFWQHVLHDWTCPSVCHSTVMWSTFCQKCCPCSKTAFRSLTVCFLSVSNLFWALLSLCENFLVRAFQNLNFVVWPGFTAYQIRHLCIWTADA